MKRGSVDYEKQLYCKHEGTKHLRENCKLIYGYGYACPDCGRKLRTKAKYNYLNRMKLHPYIKKGRHGPYIKTEIKRLVQNC